MALIFLKKYSQSSPTHLTFDRKVTKWKAVVYHLKGQAEQARNEQLHLSQNTTFWIPSVAKKKKKTIEQTLLPSINDSQHDQKKKKKSQSNNVKTADKYMEKIMIEVMSLDMHHLH